MKYILGIDIGTGSTKAVAVGLDHIAAESSQFFYPTMAARPGYSEQDPELIWKAFQQSIRKVVEKMGIPPQTISLSSAMHSLIAVDEQGNALAPMITWADSRAAGVAAELLSTPLGTDLYRLTGTPIHSMSPLSKLIWIRENDPALLKNAFKFISIKEYIWFKLFKKFECDHSIASCTGLMDVHHLSWSDKALAAAGIAADKLSALVPTSYFRDDFNPSETLPFLYAGTTFVIGASDGCMANLGTGAIEPGTAALTIGTSGALRVAGKQAVFNEKAMTFSYLLDEKIFINGGPINNGGIALKWHLKNISDNGELTDADYDSAFLEAGKVACGADGLIFLSYLQGERAPIWDSNSCGTFFGLTLKHHRQHFTRAVIEGICFALNDVLQSLVASGQEIHQLNVSGGFVSSPLWLQILADITGKKLVLATTEDASAVGAAYLAMKATGLSSGYPLPERKERSVIMPDKDNHALYQRYFDVYRKLYPQLRSLMHELKELN
jgi:gluconokinase